MTRGDAERAIRAPSTRYAVTDAVAILLGRDRDRDPIDAIEDAELALAIVTALARMESHDAD